MRKGENDILTTFKRGELRPFYNEYYAPLLWFASRLLDETGAFLSEDCVQNAIFKAYEVRASFQNLAQFKSFLYTCIRNECISIHRRQQSQSNYLATLDYQEDCFDIGLAESEMMHLLHSAMQALPDKYRQVLELNIFKGKKTKEIAEILGISERTVKNYKASALDLLRDRLSEQKSWASMELSCWLLFLQALDCYTQN